MALVDQDIKEAEIMLANYNQVTHELFKIKLFI